MRDIGKPRLPRHGTIQPRSTRQRHILKAAADPAAQVVMLGQGIVKTVGRIRQLDMPQKPLPAQNVQIAVHLCTTQARPLLSELCIHLLRRWVIVQPPNGLQHLPPLYRIALDHKESILRFCD